MKRAILSALGVLAVAGAALALAWARPDLLPDWARPAGPEAGRQVASEDSGLFCVEHGVPEKFCTLCHPELEETLLLCAEHGGIPEDICTLCHPEVAEKHGIKDLCPHGLPRHFCREHGEPQASNAVDDGWCSLHAQPEEACTECEGGRPKGLAASGAGASCREPLPLVRFARPELAGTIGLETAEAIEDRHAHRLRANAEVAYDANRYAEVSPRVSGFLREVKVDLGRQVRAGEVLAVVDSAEVSAAKSQHLAAQAGLRLASDNYTRISALARSDAVARKEEVAARAELNRAEAAARDAEGRLRNLGFTDSDLAQILATGETRSELPLVAPIAGTVVARHAVRGEAVQPTSQLFAVADTSRMWLWIDAYEGDIAAVAPGQPVAFAISGAGGPPLPGEVTWVGTEVDPKTRTTRVRAELANPDGRLRANQFGTAEIRVGPEHSAVVVPEEAVQRQDDADLVFVPVEPGRYRPQRVLAGPAGREGFLEVSWGLQPGQRVVTTGAFLLKTEITRGAIGAGCCE